MAFDVYAIKMMLIIRAHQSHHSNVLNISYGFGSKWENFRSFVNWFCDGKKSSDIRWFLEMNQEKVSFTNVAWFWCSIKVYGKHFGKPCLIEQLTHVLELKATKLYIFSIHFRCHSLYVAESELRLLSFDIYIHIVTHECIVDAIPIQCLLTTFLSGAFRFIFLAKNVDAIGFCSRSNVCEMRIFRINQALLSNALFSSEGAFFINWNSENVFHPIVTDVSSHMT